MPTDIAITVEWDQRTMRFLIRDPNTGDLLRTNDITYLGDGFGPRTFEFETRETFTSTGGSRGLFRKEWAVYMTSQGETRARLSQVWIESEQ